MEKYKELVLRQEKLMTAMVRHKLMTRITGIVFVVVMVVAMTFTLVGCAKIVERRTETVDVIVVDEYHRNAYTTMSRVGQTTVPIRHPEVNRITVEYNGVQYTINGEETYEFFSDRIGETVQGVLEITVWDNGKTWYDINELVK